MYIRKTQLDYTDKSAQQYSNHIKRQKIREAEKRIEQRNKFAHTLEERQQKGRYGS